MAKGKCAQTAWGAGFDSAWMARINAETARIARSFRLAEDSARAVAQSVAITIWQQCSAPEPPGSRAPGLPGSRAPGLPGSRAPGPYP